MKSPRRTPKRVHTPTVIQMEAVECGAAALAIVMGYFGRHISLEEARTACNVTRDGVKAGNIVRAAQHYGFKSQGYRKSTEKVRELSLPHIVYWNFNHFVVVEGYGAGKVYLNDPASGPRVVTWEEFNLSFTGIVITFERGAAFQSGRSKPTLQQLLRSRLSGSLTALAFILLVSFLLLIPGLLQPVFSRVFIDEILVARRDIFAPLIVLMLLTGAGMTVLAWLQQHYLLRLETKLTLQTSAQYFWRVLRLPINFFAQRYAGEIGARVALNDEVAMLLSRDLAVTLLGILLIGFYGAIMIQYNALLTGITVMIALLNLVALRYISRRRKDANQRLLQEKGKLVGLGMHGLFNIESLKARGSEDMLFRQIAGYQAKSINAEQELKFLSQVLSAIPPTLTMLATTSIIVLGSLQIIEGNMSVGSLIAFYALMTAFLLPVNDLVNLGSKLQQVEGYLQRVEDVLRYDEDRALSNETLSPAPHEIRLSGELELRNITFGYNRLSPPLIENFSLHLKPGDRVALVGSSGSGKSTIAKLITGLYEPWEGEILFDGKPRAAVPRLVLTNSLAMVDQDIFMFEGSVRENLTLWDHTIDQSLVVAAAQDAQIHNVINKRPGGYDSRVEEDGRNFSGGQRQRLEIARALVTNPAILVLDEATSALDPLTEQEIDANLRRRGCTTVIVAHRLSTIRDADETIVLENGKVVQRGTHDQLYRQKGVYRTLIAAEEHVDDGDRLLSIFDRFEE